MKRALYLAILVAIMVTLAGCGPLPVRLAQEQVEKVISEKPVVVEREALRAAPAPAPSYGGEAAPAELPQVQLGERMIIRNGELSLEVEETEKSMEKARTLVQAAGGFVAESNLWREKPEDSQPRGRIRARVPAAKFDEVMRELKALALKVKTERTSGQDVTEQFVDLEARLKNLKAVEEELRTLLTEVRAKTAKAEDVMAVYRELTKVREEIERVTGRKKLLEDQVALATIAVEFIPKEKEKPIVEPSWRPGKTVREASRSLVKALQRLVDWLIWLVIGALPLLLVVIIALGVLALIFWLAVRGIIRATRRRMKA